ncbi:sensor histidine kinase [Thalassotalea sp. PLHSN55]|uniref:sensor histidine kinase n=1 Tax=Thalassotalea sp. PLHSN55 TaxID=3435888 RepID=UPI003F82D77A
MKFSLYQRLAISLSLVFILLVGFFYFWFQQVEQRTRFESEQNLHLSLAANLARDNPLLAQGIYDHSALENLFHTLMVLGPAFEFYFVDPTGLLLTYSASPSQVKRDKINLIPLLQLTRNQAPLPIYGDDPRHLTRQKIFSAAPVFNGSDLQGYLYVIVAGEKYDSAFNRIQSNNHTIVSLVFIGGSVFFLFVIMLGLFRYFTAPLRKLSKDMNAFKNAGFDKSLVNLETWQSQSHNEVHQLGSIFSQMVEQINGQLERLKQSDSHRRQLLADISHDLRTPLASLQGYLETIAIKGEALPSEQRDNYLSIAHKNACQLKVLIDQIFELAHLEDGQVSLNLEVFNLAELLYDIVAKFSLAAEKKQISLTIEPKFPIIQAHSDIGKIERVLSNLIENALRHTPKGGAITLKVSNCDQKHCQLSVQDTGTGIKHEELAYIFDARYRASNATHSQGQHTGLGLAITKKLLTLLHTDIRVKSELGKGSEFAFNIRVANEQ